MKIKEKLQTGNSRWIAVILGMIASVLILLERRDFALVIFIIAIVFGIIGFFKVK